MSESQTPDKALVGRVAIILGAGRSGSIGAAIARRFGLEGASVVVSDWSPAEGKASSDRAGQLDRVVSSLRTDGLRVIGVPADVTSNRSLEALTGATQREFGRVDAVVNCAAAARGRDRVPLIHLSQVEWDRVMRINLRGAFLVLRHFSRVLVAQGEGGSLLSISSLDGKLGSPNSAAYGSSKAALQALTASLSQELGPYGIRANCICPGLIDTPRLNGMPDEEKRLYISQNVPLDRAGTPDDVASLAVFLSSPQADWISGQSWNVDGGQLSIR